MLLQPAPGCGGARSLLLTVPKLRQLNVEIGLAWAGSLSLTKYPSAQLRAVFFS